ncbi:MAG: HNH endonuclease signature motif containing protein [Candidatus Peribacteraceae bacterium]
MNRSQIPTELKRKVLLEAGHRCAIPTCQHSTTEIAHIIPWAKVTEHQFENLIALCPNCHTRFDNGEIDKKSMMQYKANLKSDKPQLDLEAVTVNVPNPNPEIGYDSEYILRIRTPYTITNFSFSIKVPLSANPELPINLFSDDARGERAWYDPKISDGIATFDVSHAGGEYHIVLAHNRLETLTMDDVSW